MRQFLMIAALTATTTGGAVADVGHEVAAERATRAERIRADMARFLERPREFMGEVPRKTDSRGRLVSPKASRFSQRMTRSRDFVLRKNELRKLPGGAADPNPSEPDLFDRPEAVADLVRHRTLDSIDRAGLKAARLARNPWSDDYWALYRGGLAQRYAEPEFPGSVDWKANADYVKSRLDVNASSTDTLSPAEKYDLLVGDESFSLTRASLRAGEVYYERTGEVEMWMGYCHGWAAASYVMPRPARRISATTAGGAKIDFYPSDIKALATLLWSESPGQTRSTGRRCDVKSPKTNDNGRIIDPECFDTNPATWHLAVVNQIGVAKRSLVLDATFDYQVWNQPIVGYSYAYFDPNTGEPVESLEKARVPLAKFEKDKFKEFRGPNTSSVVGVSMDLTYVGESSPSHAERDSEKDDRTMTVNYYYDLELDESGRVVGGEWYGYGHPDFLWGATKGARALTRADVAIDRAEPGSGWDGTRAMPELWQRHARQASRQGTPIAKVVEALTALSSAGI